MRVILRRFTAHILLVVMLRLLGGTAMMVLLMSIGVLLRA